MKKLATVVLCLLAHAAFAQNEGNNWIFGRAASLNFGPQPFTGAPAASLGAAPLEGSAVISDASGKLQFYTDGLMVWNANHLLMTNGNGLKGGSSATQSALIVPWPGTECKKWLIFTVQAQEEVGKGDQELNYSVVDMSQSGGLGSVTSKNNLLESAVTEKLTGVADGSGAYWVVAHRFTKSNNTSSINSEFCAYHVTASGVSGPVVSTGWPHVVGSGTHAPGVASAGQMKISPDGTLIAAAVNTAFVEIHHFDRTTGKVIPPSMKIDADAGSGNPKPPFGDSSVYGLEWSPNDNYLYIATLRNSGELFQFTNLFSTPSGVSVAPGSGGSGYDIGELQLAPNGKIYVARNNQTYVGVINAPNSSSCQYVGNGAPLLTGKSELGLPTVIQGSYACAGVTVSLSLDDDQRRRLLLRGRAARG